MSSSISKLAIISGILIQAMTIPQASAAEVTELQTERHKRQVGHVPFWLIDRTTLENIPQEIFKKEIFPYLSMMDLFRFGQTNPWVQLNVNQYLKTEDGVLDLSKHDRIKEKDLMEIFSNWTFETLRLPHPNHHINDINIKSLPLDQLSPTSDGRARLELNSSSNEIWKYMGKHPYHPNELGRGWRDPNGIYWYDIAKDENGNILHLNHWDASLYCENWNLRLPTNVESYTLDSLRDDLETIIFPVDRKFNRSWTSTMAPQRLLLTPTIDYSGLFWITPVDLAQYQYIRHPSDKMAVRCIWKTE